MTIQQFHLWLRNPDRPPSIMGILNVTPDSFSDGGRFLDVTSAVGRAHEMIRSGASLIDVGGESTRPGSEPVPEAEQIRRIVPVIRQLKAIGPILLSIDTSRAAVAEAGLDAGAGLINDVFAGRDDPELLPLAARHRVPVILMHMQGRPATMQQNPVYGDVVAEVRAFLEQRISAAERAGIDPVQILIDPGIGFGKTVEHNLDLLRRLREFKSLGHPLVIGTSRKGFISAITGENAASGRLLGTAATVAWSIANGTDLVRVHDVGPMSQVVQMIGAIQTGRTAVFPPAP